MLHNTEACLSMNDFPTGEAARIMERLRLQEISVPSAPNCCTKSRVGQANLPVISAPQPPRPRRDIEAYQENERSILRTEHDAGG
jgi:hypothetical protein